MKYQRQKKISFLLIIILV